MWCVGGARCVTDDDADGVTPTIVTYAARELVDGRLVVCVATRRARRRDDDDGGGLNSRHRRRPRDESDAGDAENDGRAWAAMTVDADRTRRDVRRARGIELASTRDGMRDCMKRALDKGEARVDARGVTTTTSSTSSSAGGGDDVTFRWVTSAWDDEEAPRGYVETLEWINEALTERAARRDARGGEGETAAEAEEVEKMGKSPVKGTTSIGRWLSDRRERVRLAAAAAAASEDEDEDDDEATRGKKMRT